ncbi:MULTISPECIES: diaminopimelate epimerase [Rhodomicrobium]|uniref:diaminopimelate epimerase n=1 Tax=Rhodomicrobium TaxID=1068 RepID=UPI000B4AA5A8|nr:MULTISPECIES: diaminopimelate epimerase [Rhodomicrobium]
MTKTEHSFRKMNGLGNDFAVLDARVSGLRLDAKAARRIADRERGVGCDQVIVIERSNGADAFMRILNADGSEVNACGNATRCVAALLAGETGRPEVSIQTGAGILNAAVREDGLVTVDMGEPRFGWNEIPLARPFGDTANLDVSFDARGAPSLRSPGVVNVGNPHCIFVVDNAAAYDLAEIGPRIEYDRLFPERVNVSLAEFISPEEIRLHVWERGAGLTRACGTAACAAAVATARKGLTGRRVTVGLPGGNLMIDWRVADGHILMTGPWHLDYEGVFEFGEPAPAN